MKATFRPTTPQDEAQLIAFLARAFSKHRKSPFLDAALLRWKFWTEREDFKDPRSYVLERNGEFIAHVGLWPSVLCSGGNTWRGAHMIDWASEPKAPGSGVSLLARIVGLFDFAFSIGGGDMTRRILPAFGFKSTTSFWTAARPLKPLKQMLSHQHSNCKLPLRFARNAWWSRIPRGPSLSGWSALPVNPGYLPDEAPMIDSSASSICRDNAFFRYIQACPRTKVLLFQLLKHGNQAGTFALSITGKQARIAGVWPKTDSPGTLAAAYTLAQHEARRFDDAYEIIAGGSTANTELAAAEAGLRVRGRMPVFLLERSGAFPERSFEFQLVDNDAFFLRADLPEFLT